MTDPQPARTGRPLAPGFGRPRSSAVAAGRGAGCPACCTGAPTSGACAGHVVGLSPPGRRRAARARPTRRGRSPCCRRGATAGPGTARRGAATAGARAGALRRLERRRSRSSTAPRCTRADARPTRMRLELRPSSTTGRACCAVAARLHNAGDRRRTPLDVAALAAALPLPRPGRRAARPHRAAGAASAHPQRTPPRPRAPGLREPRRGRTGHDATLLLCAGHPRVRLPATARCGPCTSPGAATTSTSPSAPRGRRRHARCSAAASCCARARSASHPGETYAAPPVVFVLLGRGARRPSRAASTAACGPAPGAPARALGRWCSTPGRRSTSTTTSTGSPALADAAAADRRRALRAGRRLVPAAAATTAPGSATGSSTPDVWPDGLRRWSTTSTAWACEFGLWVEPEMVNRDSDLARAHPDWVLRAGDAAAARPGAAPAGARPGAPDAWAHLLARLDALRRASTASTT